MADVLSVTLLPVPAAGIPHRRRWWPYGRVQVSGSSMRPTLADGDRLLVRWGAAPRPGKLVVVRLPDGTPAVKRAFGRDGAGWWVERDNPQEGVDSWQVGAIPAADVLGTIVLRYRRGS